MTDLIKQVGGIEKAKEIVGGAPAWAKGYNTVIQKYTRGVWFSRDFRLDDLRQAIADYNTVVTDSHINEADRLNRRG